VRAGLIGPRLSALVAYQKGACHMSCTSIEKFFGDVLRLDISRGQLAKVVQKGSAALGACYAQLQAVLPKQQTLNVDETGHPECGKKLWTWGFHAPGSEGFTWFHIDPSRSSEVLREFLGETFRGVPGCDYFSAYRKFLDETDAVMQFCWAHLVRDVKFLTTLSDPVTARFGAKLLAAVKVLFRVWHRRSAEPAERWKRDAERAKQEVLKVVRRAPSRSEAVFWFSELPCEKECYTPASDGGEITDEENWLRIDKPVKPALPRPPADCEHWFDAARPEDVSAEPRLHDEIVDPKWVPGDRQNGDESDSTPPPRLLLSDHPHVALAWGKYLEAKWCPWIAQSQRWERVQKAYRKLFTIYQEQQRRGEQYELLLGVGVLLWTTASDHKVRRPIVTARVTIALERHGTKSSMRLSAVFAVVHEFWSRGRRAQARAIPS
jgi:hypothetical protein